MSKGPGLWQRLVVQMLAREQSFPLRECWRLVAPERGSWTRSEYSALCRAVHSLAKRGQCQLIRADDLEDGRRRRSKTDQPILFIAQPGLTVRRWHRQRSTTRQWVTVISFDRSGALEWHHDPTPNPDGSTWVRQTMTGSDGHTGDAQDGEKWYGRKVLVREADITLLEHLVGLGGIASERENAYWDRESRRLLGQATGADYPAVVPDEKPYARGIWEPLLPPGLVGEKLRAVALAIIVILGRLPSSEAGPTIDRLQELASAPLSRTLRRLAKSGYLHINDDDQLFMLRPNAMPWRANTTQTMTRLGRILGRQAQRRSDGGYDDVGTAELVAEIMPETISVEAMRGIAGG